jgi:glyoxylase-like metal-dependent hydrolase (beta-lactamase superfamily II)
LHILKNRDNSSDSIRVHALYTGGTEVRPASLHRWGGALTSTLRILSDQTFSPVLPIWSWLIEHPEGNIIVDTGASRGLTDPDYLRRLGPFQSRLLGRLSRFTVKPEDEITFRLAALGRTVEEIRWVVFTHLHLDHVDGLGAFGHSEVVIDENEWSHPHFAPKPLFPPWLNPTPARLRSGLIDCFDRAYPITQDGTVLLVSTPGHTPHHCSVLVHTGSISYLLAGDAVYDQAQLLADRDSGVDADFTKAAQTRRAIRTYASRYPTVLLPSHDPESENRLIHGTVLEIKTP